MADTIDQVKAENGALGGQATFEKYGSDHMRKLAAKRKNCRGGRPAVKKKTKARAKPKPSKKKKKSSR